MTAKRLYQSIARQIAEMIDEGALPPGSRLPGERELAEKFEVSRVTIREAEIALQAIGRLEIKTGSGVYVSEAKPQSDEALPSVSAFEVTEARMLIESEAAALAARHISDEQIEQIESYVSRMAVGGKEEADEADEMFHATIAKASKNAAIVHSVKQLWRMRDSIPRVKAVYESVCDNNQDLRTQEHRAVLNALKARDSGAARTAMREHFQRLIETMLDTTERQALAEVQEQASASRERFLAAAKLH